MDDIKTFNIDTDNRRHNQYTPILRKKKDKSKEEHKENKDNKENIKRNEKGSIDIKT